MDAKTIRGLVSLAARHCSAQSSRGLWTTLFLARSFCARQSPFSAPQSRGPGADAARLNEYLIVADGLVVAASFCRLPDRNTARWSGP
jgi:hypothetical protein